MGKKMPKMTNKYWRDLLQELSNSLFKTKMEALHASGRLKGATHSEKRKIAREINDFINRSQRFQEKISLFGQKKIRGSKVQFPDLNFARHY